MNYLYNGVELPDINSVYTQELQEKYPYAVISVENSIHYSFLIAQKPFRWENDGLNSGLLLDKSTLYEHYSHKISEGKWDFYLRAISGIGKVKICDKAIWANHDILYKDSTEVCLAASDPIPVGTAPALDPLSLFMGWKAGNWVARQRGKAKPATCVYDDTMPIEWKMQDVANNKKIPAKTYQIYSYNGLEFGRPDIEADSAYKYHLIEKYSSGYHYWCLKQPFVYINEDKEYAKIEGGYNYSLYICKTGEIGFAHHDDISGDDLKLNWEDIIWTNTNICDADGTVRMAATEPVYIREQVKDWFVKISNYIPSPEIFEKSAVSISYGGEEAILTYVFGDNSYTGCTIVLFMDVTTYTNFAMLAIEKADNEVIPGEPGLYFLTDESIPSDVTFKFFVPDET